MTKINTNIFWMGIVSFFTDMASSLVMPLLPFFIVIILDQGVDKLGVVLAVTTIASYLLRFVGGIASDKLDSNKRFLIFGYGLSALAKPFLSVADGWGTVAAVQASERLGKAVRAAPKDKLISMSAQQHNMGASLGIHKTIEKCGEVLGLLMVFGIIAYWGMSEDVFRAVFLASVIPGILSLLMLILFVKEMRGGKSKKKTRLALNVEPNIRWVIAGFIMITFFSFNESFYLLLGNDFGFDIKTILLLLIAVKGLQMLVSNKIGRFIDRQSIRIQMTVGYLLGVMLMLLLCTSSLTDYVISFLLFGLQEVIMLIGIRSYIGKFAADKGAAFGFLYFVIAIFSALSAYVTGAIWQYQSAQTAIMVNTIGVVLSGLLLLSFQRKRDQFKEH